MHMLVPGESALKTWYFSKQPDTVVYPTLVFYALWALILLSPLELLGYVSIAVIQLLGG